MANIPFSTGSMTFTDALMQAKRASQLREVPFSTRDVQNLQSGYMEGAAERMAGERSSALAEKSQTAQETNWTNTLAQEKELNAANLTQQKGLAEAGLATERELSGLSRAQTERLTQAQMDVQGSAANKALTGNVISTGATLGGAYLIAPASTQAAIGAGLSSTGAVTGGAAAGYVAPKLIEAVHEDSMENTGQNVSFGLIEDEESASEFGGLFHGAAAGAAVGGPVGAVAGGIAGWFSGGGCIIVTACTDRHSPEVEIAREYRDKFLDPVTLRGYYMIAEKVVPVITRFSLVKWFVKRFLVDNLIAYGRHALDKGPRPKPTARAVTKVFLRLCGSIGSRRASFVRCNGEIV